MSELNLKQIIDRLNTEFVGDRRKLVFWYDDHADFAEDIDEVHLDNAKVLKLETDTQFQTKYFLERQDKATNYLVYAPFPKPNVSENHLEDTLLYSKRFYADRASLLSAELGIEEKYRDIIKKHSAFFASKERAQRFYDLAIGNFNEESILIGLMSAICRNKSCSFDEVIRVLFTDDCLINNKFIAEFDKYNLLPSFWKFCEQQFGYADHKPALEKLIVTMFVTHMGKYILKDVPKEWKSFVSYKSGNIIAFLDNLMNNRLYRERYNQLAAHVATDLSVSVVLERYEPDDLLECDSFMQIDHRILQWLISRLLAEDTGAKLHNHTIAELCEMRKKMHFGELFADAYDLLKNAYHLILDAGYICPDPFNRIIEQYTSADYRIDTQYRKFYECYDALDNTGEFETLRDLVENIYTNEYLAKLLPKWNKGIIEQDALSALPLQRNFFERYVKNNKDRTVVIISDALRYEVGCELFAKMQDDPKCSARMEGMLSTLPSYTRLGMAALLPHAALELTDDGRELVNGVYCADLAARQAVLQAVVPESCCVQFDVIQNMKKAALREVFTGKQVVYVYHDQIDVRGEHSENEVFVACKEAVAEIIELIRRISTNANTLHFIVTADHGFIYKRDKVLERDKIGGVSDKGTIVKRRYIISEQPILDDGICNLGLGYLLGNEDNKVVSFPCSTSIFKTPGAGGQNYVHGGSSPQEMILPVIDIKMEKGHMNTRNVQIMLVSIVQKITDFITTLDFIQSDPVSDVVKESSFRLYFISEDNEKISSETIYIADKRETDAQKRIFRMRFTFKNKRYDKDRHYYLVAYDEMSGMEVFRHAVVMDISCDDDLKFGL